jgi:hypothetical protein
LDVSSLLEASNDAFIGDVNSALVKYPMILELSLNLTLFIYRQDIYSYLTASAERLERGLCGHEDLINSVFFLLLSPDKLVRASVSEFLRVYVCSVVCLFF